MTLDLTKDQEQDQDEKFYAGSSSLYWVHVQVFIGDLFKLSRRNDLYFMNSHPIQMVCIVGIITGIHKKTTRIQINVDDGTGVIGCTCWVNEGFSPPSFKLGDLVTINGKLGAYNDQLQVSMSSHRIEKDPNYEILHWAQAIKLRRQVYDTAFIPASNIVESHSLSLQRQQLLNTKNEEVKDTESSNGIVKELLKDTIESLETFTFKDLIANVQLVTTVESLFSIKDAQAHFYISKTLQKLVNEGFVYPLPSSGYPQAQEEEEEERYQIVNRSNLGQSILQIVQKGDIDLIADAAVDIIASRVRQIPHFSKIPRHIVVDMFREQFFAAEKL